MKQSVQERELEIQNEKKRAEYLNSNVIELNGIIKDFQSSHSWRLTKPLRKAGFFIRRVRSYFQKKIKLFSLEGQNSELLVIKEREAAPDANTTIAVHVHLFYIDQLDSIKNYLKNIPNKFDLYISTDTAAKANNIVYYFSKNSVSKKVKVKVVKNIGRDIYPFLVTFGSRLSKYDLVLHIHSKRSPQNQLKFSGWRRYLFENLLGSKKIVNSIIDNFQKNPNIGLLFPEHYMEIRPLIYENTAAAEVANDPAIQKIISRFNGIEDVNYEKIDKKLFPSGSMFWIRGDVIKKILSIKLTQKDFDEECGQLDGTLAHALERLFSYFTLKSGYIYRKYISEHFQGGENSAIKIEFFDQYLKNSYIKNCVVMFDHNGGGGSGQYTSTLLNKLQEVDLSIIRIYYSNNKWMLQWVKEGDGNLFITDSIEALFYRLNSLEINEIIINSLYGVTQPSKLVDEIVNLASRKKIDISFKVHDFLSICPSPHLLNTQEKYCGVPNSPDGCSNCLPNLGGWYHTWYPEKNKPQNILEWREPYKKLLEHCKEITFFDKSSIEIMEKAFKIDHDVIKIKPHDCDYFKVETPLTKRSYLKIGILGYLTPHKGGNVVASLHRYLRENNLETPIVVEGQTYVDLPNDIHVHGAYLPSELPVILENHHISVIFMSSIVPETFSYTVSEAMKLDLPIVAFDIGAQGSRVRSYSKGVVVPLNSSMEEIYHAIEKAFELRNIR